jgi:hypothetical protein
MKRWIYVSLSLLTLFSLSLSHCSSVKADPATLIATPSGSVQPIEPPINDAAILFMGILAIEIIVLLAVIWAAWRRGRR